MVEMHICNEAPGYEMDMFPFNYTRDSDFIDLLLNITFTSQSLWFKERNATWLGEINPKYVETLTMNGIGFTFNTFDADEVLNTDT